MQVKSQLYEVSGNSVVYEHPQNSTGHFAHGRGAIVCIWNAFQKGRRLRGGAQQYVSQFSGAHPHGTVEPQFLPLSLFLLSHQACVLSLVSTLCHFTSDPEPTGTTKHTLKPPKLCQNKPYTSPVHNLRVCCPGRSWHRGSLLYTVTQSPLFLPEVPHR